MMEGEGGRNNGFCRDLLLDTWLGGATQGRSFSRNERSRLSRRVRLPPHEAVAAIGLEQRKMICHSLLVEKPNNDFEQPVQMIDLPPPPPPPAPTPPFLPVKALIYGDGADDGELRYPV